MTDLGITENDYHTEWYLTGRKNQLLKELSEEDICFKLTCYYMAITELFDRTLTDKRSKYDNTEAFVCNSLDRSLSNKNAMQTYEKVIKIAECIFRISRHIFIENFRQQIKTKHFSAQGWIDQYNFLCENGEMDFIKECL